MQDFLKKVNAKIDKKYNCKKCIFTFFSPGHENLFYDMITSLKYFSILDDSISVFAFVANPDASCLKIIEQTGIHIISCHTVNENKVNIDTKAIVYSVFEFINAEYYIYLDSDLLFLSDINKIFDFLQYVPEDNIAVCKDQYFYWAESLGQSLIGTLYNGNLEEIKNLVGESCFNDIINYKYTLNSGIFAGSKKAIVNLYKTLSSFNNVADWAKRGFLREQFLFNLALAKLNNVSLLKQSFNFQLCTKPDVQLQNNNLKINYYNFFLDFLSDPEIVFKQLFVKNKYNEYIFKNLQQDTIKLINSRQKLNRLKQIELLEFIFNTLLLDNNLFDKQYNTICEKKILLTNLYFKNFVFDEYLEDEIFILHFNGPDKNYNNLRKKIINFNNDPQKIKILISTNKNYQDISLPPLLNSLKQSGVENDRIIVVSGGWPEDKKTKINNIEYYYVTHNSFDLTALITIIENNLHNQHWFVLHDTCYVGENFNNILNNFEIKNYEYICVDKGGYLNMGIMSDNFIYNCKNFILSFKNCSKKRAMLCEKTITQLGNTLLLDSPVLVENKDFYGTGINRNILYYKSFDLFKLQLNIVESSNLTVI